MQIPSLTLSPSGDDISTVRSHFPSSLLGITPKGWQEGVDRVGHYLDDFVLVGPLGSRDCSRFLQVALRVCRDSGFPVAEEKTVGPTTLIPLLGMVLDSEWVELRLPPGKLTKL